MQFNELLNDYIQMLDISSSALSERSGISTSSISRYRTGEREPAYDSEYLDQLIKALYDIAMEKKIDLDYEDFSRKLHTSLNSYLGIDYEQYLDNLSTILKAFDIKVNSVAKHLSYDPSHISKILSGQRRPGNISTFTNDISSYIVSRLNNDEDYVKIEKLIENISTKDMNNSELQEHITYWIKNYNPANFENEMNANDPTEFLRNLDKFDLEEYIRAIHFNDIKVPTVPLQLPQSKSYYGLDQFKEAEINFLKITALSKKRGAVIMYSDMPMIDMSKDKSFAKKWMIGIAAMLRKGLTLNMIHKIDRPWDEMMLGLEAWIPMYMTGQINPYYMEEYPTSVFHQLLSISDACALQGEAVIGHHKDGKYYLTTKKSEVDYYRTRALHMLEAAKPLMDIYNSSRSKEFINTLKKLTSVTGKEYKIVMSTLPIYTMDEKLLDRILKRAIGKESKKINAIKEFAKKNKKFYENIVKENRVIDEIPIIDKEEFEKHPPCLSLYGSFLPDTIPYTYEEYMEHLETTRQYAKKKENYLLSETKNAPFRNIQILILSGKYVIVSKNTSPAIHFVIYHPRLVNAIENMTVPIND